MKICPQIGEEVGHLNGSYSKEGGGHYSRVCGD